MIDSLDAFDRRLLDLLSRDSRRTGKELAARVGLSQAACLRRVQRLRESGAIAREVAILAPEIRGAGVTVLVLLRLSRERPDRIDALKAKLRRLREVERFYHVTGEADFALIVACPSMEDYAAFTEAHFYDDPVRGFDSLVVLREHVREDPEP